MRNIKRRMEWISLYNREQVEQHLTRMAQKGWLLDTVGPLFWTYRRIEPKPLIFSLAYCPQAGLANPELPEEELEFNEYCFHSGWNLIQTVDKIKIFYHEDPEATPLESDPAIQVDSIYRTWRRGFRFAIPYKLLYGIIFPFFVIYASLKAPLRVLSYPILDFSLLFILLALLDLVDTALVLLWHHRAKKRLRQGLLPPVLRSFPAFQMILRILLVLGLAFMIFGAPYYRVLVPGFFLLAPAGIHVCIWLYDFFTRNIPSGNITNGLTAIVLLVVILCLSSALFFICQKAPIAQTALPLEAEELLEATPAEMVEHHSYSESLFARNYNVMYYLEAEEDYDFIAYRELILNYRQLVIKVPWAYDLCKKDFIENVDYPIDPACWGADEAYVVISKESFYYFLCYEDTLVSIRFTDTPTQAQMDLVAERLGQK